MNMFSPQKEVFELHLVVWGRVQGVGFRVAAKHYASSLELTGTVSNLEDGNVEIFAQGPREKLEEFITVLKKHFGVGYIARTDAKFEKPTKSYSQFKII